MNKDEIITASANAFRQLTMACDDLDEAIFFRLAGDKWSVAENLQHLVISTKMTRLAYRLPRWIVRWVGGTPNRPSRNYDEVLAKYKRKLTEGGRASSRYVPKSLEKKYSKDKLMRNWKKATDDYIYALNNCRSDNDLDHYLAAHPLLGKLTLRELCYFTLFHSLHHLETIQKIVANRS